MSTKKDNKDRNQILIFIGIVILVGLVISLRADNKRLEEEAKQGEFNRNLTDSVYKQCLKDQPNEKHYLCTNLLEVIQETQFQND